MGGCASRPKDLAGQTSGKVPVEAVATTEVTNKTLEVEATPEVAAVAEATEESRQEEASAEPKAEEAKTDETNGDDAKEDGQKGHEGIAA